jgi:hypothetical protein
MSGKRHARRQTPDRAAIGPADDGAQAEVIAFLSRPDTYGHAVAAVDRVETHISVVFLAGDRAYKLKRAVRFPYLDFSTPALRAAACEAELAVNRRTAPDIYKGVVEVVRDRAGRLRLGGEETAVDWLVEMVRFDQACLFDRLARRGALDRHIMADVAEVIAGFHGQAEVRNAGGGRAGIAEILASNAACFEDLPEGLLESGKLDRLNAASRSALADRVPLLEMRRDGGFVRRCHGDLHLRNVFLSDGRPILFDAIEFSEALASIDVMYDLAFLLMDLDHRDLRGLANVVMNAYLDATTDEDGVALLPLFLSVRAAVRAHVSAANAPRAPGLAEQDAFVCEARAYLDTALGYFAPEPARLVAIGGLSGSGKSRAGRELAPLLGRAPGARVLRTDVIRKRLSGVNVRERLGQHGYAPAMTEQTYDHLFQLSERALVAGQSVVADAVFARPDQRDAIAAVARKADVPFCGLWLEASPDVMVRRVGERRQNVSDATADVVERQLSYDLGAIEWDRVNSSGSRQDTMRKVTAAAGL